MTWEESGRLGWLEWDVITQLMGAIGRAKRMEG